MTQKNCIRIPENVANFSKIVIFLTLGNFDYRVDISSVFVIIVISSNIHLCDNSTKENSSFVGCGFLVQYTQQATSVQNLRRLLSELQMIFWCCVSVITSTLGN